MADKIQPATEKQLRRAARDHADAMIRLDSAIKRVAVTTARLTEILGRADDAPFAGGTRYERGDAAMGELGTAYERVAALFDDL